MFKIIEEETEVTIWHQLKVDDICLTACSQVAHHNGLDASCGLITSFVLDADGAGLREELVQFLPMLSILLPIQPSKELPLQWSAL